VRPEREVQKDHADPTTRSFASIFKEFRRPTRFIEKPHELLSRNGSPILAAHIGRQSEGGFDCSKLGCLELRLSDAPPSTARLAITGGATMSHAPFIVIDGRLYRWKDILELRRAQLAAAGAAQASQLALFATLHDDRRPPAERTASGRYLEPSLFAN
jgi:hypothetical protein